MQLFLSTKWKSEANEVAQMLQKAARSSDDGVYWGDTSQRVRRWQKDPIETTALVAHALLLHNPKNPLIAKAVKWLLLQKRTVGWRSTRDTAAVVFLLTELIKRSPKTKKKGDGLVSIYLRRKLIGKIQLDLTGKRRIKPFIYRGKLLRRGRNRLRIKLKSDMSVFLQTSLSFFTRRKLDKPRPGAFSITRRYYRLKLVKVGNGLMYKRIPLGKKMMINTSDLLLSQLEVVSKKAERFVMVKNPVPSGFRVVRNGRMIPIEGVSFLSQLTPQEVHAEHVAQFLPQVSAKHPIILTSILRAENPGVMNALPASASLMYFPSFRGLSPQQSFVVK